MQVPLLDLKAQYQTIQEEVQGVIQQVCEEQGFILGKRVASFEQALGTYLKVPAAVGVASGSDALLLSLMVAGVGHDDEVLTVPFTFFATTGAISRLGAKPIFVDIHPETFNMNPKQIEQALTPRTKAILPVHLFGQCAEMEAIEEIARRHHLIVIEDAAQAIGASRHGRSAGAMGDMGCFSFFPSKNLGSFGDAGAVTTHNTAFQEQLTMLRVHGSRTKYVHERIGVNSRLDALQAAILEVKLKHLDGWAERRRRNASRYEELFAQAHLLEQVTLPRTDVGNHHVFNQFTIRVPQRDALREFLSERGIGTEVYYPIPLHLQSCYENLGYSKGDFPVSELAADEVLSLPIFPELSEGQLSYIVDAISDFYKKN